MKRLHLFTICAFLLTFCANAEEITLSQARNIASRFMKGTGKEIVFTHGARRVPGKIQDSDVEPYYIFNAQRDKGFVIVAGNDAYGQILGYSDQGNLDMTDAPDGLKALLQMYQILMQKAEASPTAPSQEMGTVIVNPLLGDIQWGQSAPYNNMCPTYTEGSTVTPYYVGCVATAMSQIMKYWNYPQQGNGEKTYTSNIGALTENFGATTYNWDNILDTYTGMYTQSQANEVAKLCRQVAVSVEMTWMKDGSGAFSQYVEGAMEQYFGYDKSASYIIRDYYPTDQWMQLIKSELDAKRPVFYSASNEDGLGGHAFVADGYDSNDYIHINWGWFGKSNGYFMVNALNPYELGIGANGGGYNLHQEIVIGIQPECGAGNGLPAVYSSTRMAGGLFGTIYLMCYLENDDAKPFNGKVGAVLVQDGNIVKVLKADALQLNGVTQSNSKLLVDAKIVKVDDIPAAVSGVANGKYELRYAVCPEGSDTWSIVHNTQGMPSFLEATVTGGNITIQNHEMKPMGKLLTQIVPDGSVYAGGAACLTMTLQNLSSEMNIAKIRLGLVPVGETVAACVLKDKSDVFNIYDQSTKEITMLTTIPADLLPGEYDVIAYENGYEQYQFDDSQVGRTHITILPAATTPVVRAISDVAWSSSTGSESICQGETLVALMHTRNYGAEGFVDMLMKLRDAQGNEHPFYQVSKSQTPGQQTPVAFQRRLDVDPGTYSFVPYYITADGVEHPMENASQLSTLTVLANDNLLLECENLELPSQMNSGTKYNGSITVRALKDFSYKTLYIRLRQFTNTNGEIVYMRSSMSMKAGETQTLTFSYKPAIEDAQYMPIIEIKTATNVYEPLAGFGNYGQVFTIGETTGIQDITIQDNNTQDAVIYNLNGQRINTATRGMYIQNGRKIIK